MKAEGRGGEQAEAGDAVAECGSKSRGSRTPVYTPEEGTCPERLLEII